VGELLSEAVKSGVAQISTRSARRLDCCIDACAKELLLQAIDKFADTSDQLGKEEQQQSTLADRRVIATPETTTTTAVAPPVADGIPEVTPVPLESQMQLEEEDGDSNVDELLLELQEEVLLQSLLHKRIHEKKERVFTLEHRNGNKMLVVLPPDVRSASKFEKEAKQTGWVDHVFNSEEKCLGVLQHFAKKTP
jgi:hypothetical protein